MAVHTDVTDEDSTAAMADAVLDRWGRIDGLINNAGGAMYPTAPIDTISRAQWDHVFAVNVTGQYLCTVAVLPTMRQARYGKIVNICSTCFDKGTPVGLAPYIAAKGGSLGLTRALAHELGPHNITVNAIAPGAVDGDRIDRVIKGQADVRGIDVERMRQSFVERSPLRRMSTADDIASLAAFLCSEHARNISGQCLPVNAGEPAS